MSHTERERESETDVVKVRDTQSLSQTDALARIVYVTTLVIAFSSLDHRCPDRASKHGLHRLHVL